MTEDRNDDEEEDPEARPSSIFKTVSTGAENERWIVREAIVSTEFLRRLTGGGFFDLKLMQVDYAREVMSWVLDFFKAHHEAPGKAIQRIWSRKKQKRQIRSHGDFLETFCKQISAEYEEALKDEEPVAVNNVEFTVSEAWEYFEGQRHLKYAADIESAVHDGKLKQIGTIHERFHQTSGETLPTVDFFDKKAIGDLVFVNEEDDGDVLVKFPGKLGNLVGPLRRGWLVGFSAAAKKGKTWMLIESAYRAMNPGRGSASGGAKVLYISVEQQVKELAERFVMRALGTGRKVSRCSHTVPAFDCGLNQIDMCSRPERTNDVMLIDKRTMRERPFHPKMDYRLCTWCRDNADIFLPGENPYENMTYFKQVDAPAFSRTAFDEKVDKLLSGNGRLHLWAAPPFSTNVRAIENVLDDLKFRKSFIPDVIVVDWADMMVERSNSEFRHRMFDVWQSLKTLAFKRKSLVLTAGGINKFKSAFLTAESLSEDYRKANVVDMMIGCDHRVGERLEGQALLVNIIAARNPEIDHPPAKQVLVLNDKSCGQIILDSEDELPKAISRQDFAEDDGGFESKSVDSWQWKPSDISGNHRPRLTPEEKKAHHEEFRAAVAEAKRLQYRKLALRSQPDEENEN